MSSTIIHALLCRTGLRFEDHETERQYKEWRINTAMPFARAGYIGSAPSWLLFLASISLLEPASLPIAGPAIGSWIILLLALTALTYWTPAKRAVMPLAALANCIAGFLVAWLLYKIIGIDLVMPVKAGVMTGGVLIVMYFGFAIFRIPPWLATVGITPYILFSTHYLYQDFQAGVLNLLEAGSFASIQLIAYFGGIFVCVIIEVVTRMNFSGELRLNKTNELIRRYVPSAVAEHIISGDESVLAEPHRQNITILFSDIAGFTNITDTLEPEVTTQVLVEYMSAMSEIVESNGGTLNEFMGDGLIAIFGAPVELPAAKHAAQALRTAQQMQQRIPELVEHWRSQGNVLNLEVRIGINTGICNVGSFGSKGRMTYTAIGRNVNIAARIQLNCEAGCILISDSTYRLVRDQYDCEPMGEVECKGVHFPVKIYQLSET